ncbi:MAG: transposase [Desulfovermiculus sp.]|nr:transposase [Desulfovermiculus sp.]
MMLKPQTIRFWRGQLPHWEVADADYFITLRLAGSLPQALKEELQQIIHNVGINDVQNKSRKYFVHMEAWLDNDRRTNILTDKTVADIITLAFAEYEFRSIWKVHSYVIMPNHLHWFFRPVDRSMSDCISHFKRFTARKINDQLGTEGKRFWQREWFDHWSRTSEESEKIIQYIWNNPVKAGLVARAEDWTYMK